MSTGRNMVRSPFLSVVTASDFDGDEGKVAAVGATGTWDLAGNTSSANGIIVEVVTEGSSGLAVVYTGADPVMALGGGAIDEGAKLTPSSGKLVATTTAADIVVGIALEACSGDGVFFLMQPNFPGVEYAAIDES